MAEIKPAKAPDKFIRLLKNAIELHPDKLSLREVARRADISVAYLSLLLNGERGTPSNEAIVQLEEVLNIPKGNLCKAAGRPDDVALEFFRRDEAAQIVRSLASVPKSELPKVQKWIDGLVKRQKGGGK